MRPRLIVAATRFELEPLFRTLSEPLPLALPYGSGVGGVVHGVGVALAWLGLGKTNTAAGLALASRLLEPSAVVQVGIAGAFEGAGLELGEAAVASEEVHLDCGVRLAGDFEDMQKLGFPLLGRPRVVYNRVPLDEGLAAALGAGRWPLHTFGTSESVTGDSLEAKRLSGRFGVAVESMEGAAAAQVCLAMGIPFGEVRGVSNLVGDRDKSGWRIAPALAAMQTVVSDWLRRGAPTELT